MHLQLHLTFKLRTRCLISLVHRKCKLKIKLSSAHSKKKKIDQLKKKKKVKVEKMGMLAPTGTTG